MLANGVAVYPTYEAIGNLLKISLIQRLIVVGLSGLPDVVIDAQSASSSIIRILLQSNPFSLSSDWSLSATLSRTLLTFFTTKTTGLLISAIATFRFFCTNFLKSLIWLVNGTAKCSLVFNPTQRNSIVLPIVSLFAPITPLSVLFCVCSRKELVVPASKTTILYP